MTPCDLELFLGGGGGGLGWSLAGEKVGYCQSLSSDFLLLGDSYSVY